MRGATIADFQFNGTDTKNIRLKWLAICINVDHASGKAEFFMNGARMEGKQRKNITRPLDYQQKPLVVRIGKYYIDGTPLIGKVVDINIWDRYKRTKNIIKINYLVSLKKFTFFKCVYLRPLTSLRISSVVEMNLWIPSFKNTKSKFFMVFCF